MELIARGIDFVEAREGALLFLATLLLAYVTWRLARESALARTAAVVTMSAGIWDQNETVAVFRLVNHGPAPARSVQVSFTWREASGLQMGGVPTHRLELPALGPGEWRQYVPDTLIASLGAQRILGIPGLARDRLTLHAEWSWLDSRRRLFFFGEARHSEELDVDFTTFEQAVHGPPNLFEPPGQRVGGNVIPGRAGRTPRARELDEP